jgi:hypothetical protein
MVILLGLVCFFLIVGILISLVATVIYIGLGIWNQDSKKGAMGIKYLILTIVLFIVCKFLILDIILSFLHSLKD